MGGVAFMASDKSFADLIPDKVENAGQITCKELPELKPIKKKNFNGSKKNQRIRVSCQ